MSVFVLMLPIILIMLSGFCSARFGLLTEESSSNFTRFTFFIAMPCELFLDFAKTPLSQAINLSYIAAFAVCVLIAGSLMFYYTRYVLKKSLAETALSVMGSSQVNTAYFAIPLFILVFNNPLPVIPILLFQVFILTTIVLFMIEQTCQSQLNRQGNLAVRVVMIAIKNPLIIASLAGMLFSIFHFAVPNVAHTFFNILGNTAAPLALFALGQSLYSDLRKISKQAVNELLILSITKLLILPLLGFVVGRYLFHLSSFWLASLVLMTAMPAPKNMYIFAVKYKLDTKKAATVVALTTVFSFLTLNILLLAVKHYI